MAISKRAVKITDLIYRVYGSSSGWLFGISPDYRSAVEGIVESAIAFGKELKEEDLEEEE